jgi:hypothetical protein
MISEHDFSPRRRGFANQLGLLFANSEKSGTFSWIYKFAKS